MRESRTETALTLFAFHPPSVKAGKAMAVWWLVHSPDVTGIEFSAWRGVLDTVWATFRTILGSV
jgi:hypothetical protein